MKNIVIAVLATGFSIAPSFVNAQANNKVSGQVMTAEYKPAEGATVLLMNADTSNIVKTALADSAGKYSFDRIPGGSYRIIITLVNYKRHSSQSFSTGQQAVAIPVITLEREPKMLESVSVTASRPLIVHRQDRIVVNADAFISAAGSTVMELLEKSPGVQVDQNGNITLKGRQGVTIYIDDKPSYLEGAALDNYLKSLPASSIDQIELMSNPPAKYDAAGNAGIINIKTKKNSNKGFNGGLTLGLVQGRKTRSNNSFNFNYRNNKTSTFANFSYNLNNSLGDLLLNRVYLNTDNTPLSYFDQTTNFKRHGNTFTLKSGLDYYQSDKTTWGIVLSGTTSKSNDLTTNNSNVSDAVRQPDSIIVSRTKENNNFKNTGINLNYHTRFDKAGHELSADADYLTYRDKSTQLFHNFSYLPDETLKYMDILAGRLPGNIDIYSFKADYSRPLKNTWKLDAGLKASFAKTNNKADYTITIDDISKPDYDKSNHFIYKENINALYLNMSGKISKLSVQAGLRAENTISNGHQLGNIIKPDSAFSRSYTSIFPTLYLSYKPDSSSKHQIGFNYGRRVDRPYYQDLNPYLYPLDKFTYYTGNPFLKPAFTQSIELSHTYKNKVTTTLMYSRTKDDINETIEIRDGIYYSKPGNIGMKTIKSISVDGSFDFTKWLHLHFYSELVHASFQSNFFTGILKTSGSYVFLSPATRFSPGKGWELELNGMYRTKAKNAQFLDHSFWQANAAIQKKLSSKITLKSAIDDIFYARVVKGDIYNLAYTKMGWENRIETRKISLSISYRFGKNIPEQQRKDRSSTETEQNRVKN